MASAYPTALDTFSPTPSTLAGPVAHSVLHKQLSDALAAVEAELGVNPSDTFATVTARLLALPRGYVTGVEAATPVAPFSAATNLNSVTFTAVAGRRYRISWMAGFLASAAAVANCGIFNVAVAESYPGQTVSAAGYVLSSGEFYRVPGAVTVTYTLRAQVSAGTLTIGGNYVLAVEDVGT